MADKGLKYHVRYKARTVASRLLTSWSKGLMVYSSYCCPCFLIFLLLCTEVFPKKAKHVLRESLLYMGMIPGKSLHHVWSRHINRKTSLLRSIKVDNICFLSIWLHSTPIYLLSQSLFSPEILISFVSHLDPFPSFQVGNWLHRFSFTKLFQFLFSTASASPLPATVFRRALKHTQQLHCCSSPHHSLSLHIPPFSSLFLRCVSLRPGILHL